MGRLFEKIKYSALLGIVSLALASIVAFGWGVVKTVYVIQEIITSYGRDPHISVSLIEVIDSILISVALFVFSASLYQLFIAKLNLPTWMLANNLNDLKVKLSSMIILVMSVKFLEHLVEWKDSKETLFFGISVAIVSGILIAFSYINLKE